MLGSRLLHACLGLRSFAATPSGELLTVSVFNLPDGQLGFALASAAGRRQRDCRTGVRHRPCRSRALSATMRDSRAFVDLPRPHVAADSDRGGRSPVSSGFSSRAIAVAGWAIARFAVDGTLDTGWGADGVVVLEKGGLRTTCTGPRSPYLAAAASRRANRRLEWQRGPDSTARWTTRGSRCHQYRVPAVKSAKTRVRSPSR